MPKNTTGGNKAKKGKNSGQRVERALILVDKSGAQHYAIIDAFGGSTATVRYIRQSKESPTQLETITAVGFIRNSLRKWCKRFLKGDVVLVCEREFEKGKVDICHKYNDDEIRSLRRIGDQFIKIQPLIDEFASKMDKIGNKSQTQPNGGDEIEFDENYSEESGDEYYDDNKNDIQTQMNEEYTENRANGYKSQSNQKKNPKYTAKHTTKHTIMSTAPKLKSGGQPIPAQQGNRDMPPSSSSSEDEDS